MANDQCLWLLQKQNEKHLNKSRSDETNEVKTETDATFCVLGNASGRNARVIKEHVHCVHKFAKDY